MQILRPSVISLDEEKLNDQNVQVRKVNNPSELEAETANQGQVYKLEVGQEGDISELRELPFLVLDQVSDEDFVYIWKDSGEILGKYDLDPADFNLDLFDEERDEEVSEEVTEEEIGQEVQGEKEAEVDREEDTSDNIAMAPFGLLNADAGSENESDSIPDPISCPATDAGKEQFKNDKKLKPGQVKILKIAEPVDGKVNTWNIHLKVKAKDPLKKSTAVCLVIDTSGSMGDDSRLTDAKEKAIEFVDKLLPSTNDLKIAIVSFSSKASIKQNFTDNATLLKSAINSLSASGGTFTQAGVHKARKLLEDSEADNKHMVVLSDGEPTYSYKINDLSAKNLDMESKRRNWFGNFIIDTNSNIEKNDFDYTSTVGYGNSMWADSNDYIRLKDDNDFFHYYNIYYNHGNSAIAESNIAKNKENNIRLWTIAFNNTEIGENVLKGMSSPSSYYRADAGNLGVVFDTIAENINSSVRNAEVKDKMGEGFKVTSDEDHLPGANISNDKDEINWKNVNLTESLDDPTIKYADLTYQVELDAKDPDPNGDFYTNTDAYINYDDANGDNHTVYFGNPKVKPTFLKIIKKVEGFTDEDKQKTHNFKIDVSGIEDIPPLTIKPGDEEDKTEWLTSLRNVGDYTFEETETDPDINYDIDYNAKTESYDGGTDTSSEPGKFHVDQDTKTITLTVTNTKKQPRFKIRKLGFKEDKDVMSDIKSSLDQINGPNFDYSHDIRRGSLTVEIKSAEGDDPKAVEKIFDLSKTDSNGNYKPLYVQFESDWDSGDYTLTEKEAPAGYQKSPFEYVIHWDKEANEITLKELKLIEDESVDPEHKKYYEQADKTLYKIEEDEEDKEDCYNLGIVNMVYELPSTGGHGTQAIALTASFLMTLSAYFYIKNKRRGAGEN